MRSLNDKLNQLVATPVIGLNRAVAVAMAFGPQAGLAPRRSSQALR